MAKRTLIALFLVFSMVAPFSVALADHRGPDSAITAKVEEAIEKVMPPTPDGMNPWTIDVYTVNGAVTLRGMMVKDHIKMAEEAAKKVPGVKSVKNNISIQRSGK